MSSATSELLPDPATPVTHVSTPFGIRTERLRRLLVVAFSMRNASSKVRRLRRGGASCSLRARAVALSVRSRSSRRPLKTSSPPPPPARGPMSTTQSAARMTAGSCSTTSTELPWSRRRRSMTMS